MTTRASLAGDGGAATVFSALLSIALVAVLALALQLASGVVARHRAEGAADLAALAAAAHVVQGPEFACGRADWVARGMAIAIASCRLEGANARIEVRADSPVLGNFTAITARARAGPAGG
ncbi:flp pilus-assembly TadE/G-like family protein [Saccharopolyspora erythraea]|uniref:Rv3654c family TadE-like protein n=1 Tax=Saccharopolyspora erythraea TaxID=1836 RepID=UPI001BA6481E|nr:Rv3654c family TadE-like protein [Saccharopolyspora erythraea]QUG99728.1 flp pilus-assembly TadE/G-like family protein [Saccharopolyspora erythraea]